MRQQGSKSLGCVTNCRICQDLLFICMTRRHTIPGPRGPRHWRTCPFRKRSHAYWTCGQAHWKRSNYMTPYTSTRDFWRLRFKHQPSPGSMASRKKKPDRDMLRRKM